MDFGGFIRFLVFITFLVTFGANLNTGSSIHGVSVLHQIFVNDTVYCNSGYLAGGAYCCIQSFDKQGIEEYQTYFVSDNGNVSHAGTVAFFDCGV